MQTFQKGHEFAMRHRKESETVTISNSIESHCRELRLWCIAERTALEPTGNWNK